jgi:hypothetical protein
VREVKTRGGLVVLFERRPYGLWLALTCDKHRDWAVEWVASNGDMALPAGRASVLRVIVDTMMMQAYRHLDSCPCAKVLP